MEGYGKTFRQKAYENFANRFTGCAGKASGQFDEKGILEERSFNYARGFLEIKKPPV